MLSILFNQDVKYNNIKDVHNRLNELSPNLTNTIFDYKHLRNTKLSFKNNFNVVRKNFFQANPFKSKMDTYFSSNSLERASKVMLDCHKILEKKNNF